MVNVYVRAKRLMLATAIGVIAAVGFSACGGGGSTRAAEAGAQQGGGPGSTANSNCTGSCADTPTSLTVADVQQVIAQAVQEAQARNVRATIAVTDRVGNVLGVFKMTPRVIEDRFVTVTSSADGSAPVIGGLESVNIIPSELAAIAKAVTGAYLSSEGNAFSTRTASQIVQENFNPMEFNQPSGPLFGVQFSQLPCGDFVQRFLPGSLPGPGPRRSPLGLSADPGGLPLYKNGTPVGGIGAIADGIYGLDRDISGFDRDVDEYIATAGTVGFAAPVGRRGDVITLIGKTARFSDAFVADLMANAAAASFASITPAVGTLVAVPGYYDGGTAGTPALGTPVAGVLAGTAFGQVASGIRPAAPGEYQLNGAELDAFVFVDAQNRNLYPPSNGTDTPGGSAANALTAAEVRAVLANAIGVANRARAQIRQPDGSQVRVTVSVVDSAGAILGMARTRDAPVFGADVSLQKARTAALFSGSGRVGGPSPANQLRALPGPLYLAPTVLPTDVNGALNPANLMLVPALRPTFAGYVADLQLFIGQPTALEANGNVVAFADRSGGNLSRPVYPDGPRGGPPGPLSKPPGQWSIFSDGLQLDLSFNAVIQHVAFVLGVVPDVAQTCTGNTGFDAPARLFLSQGAIAGLANGLQIFPGSVPIFRGTTLVGAVGVSGDGVDQDDMVGFLGVHRAAQAMNNAFHNAPPALRADTLTIPGQSERLRYVNCPQAPFLDSDDDDVCDGK